MKAKCALLHTFAVVMTVAVSGCGSALSNPDDAVPVALTTTTSVQAEQIAAPNGSGNGLCFDQNSDLAQSAVADLQPPRIGTWSIGETSENPIDGGCDGVLSWMDVSSTINHPETNLLLFANGVFVGTATEKAYANTQVIGLGRNSVAVKYHWLQAGDPMCCPTGGPRVVTFTLDGTTVKWTGQFPPNAYFGAR